MGTKKDKKDGKATKITKKAGNSKKKEKIPFDCRENCFGNRNGKAKRCWVLNSQPCEDLSKCPFKKEDALYTNGVYYPWNPDYAPKGMKEGIDESRDKAVGE